MTTVTHDLRVGLLGEFAVQAPCGPLRLPQPAQKLVAYLALRRRPVPRRQAAAALWLETRDRQAGTNLRSVLSRVRRTGGAQLLRVDAAEVALAPDVLVDVWEPAPDVAQLSLDLLPGWADEWVVAERERHRQHRLHRLDRLCAEHRAAGRYADALEAGLAAVAGEPLRESAHRNVIEVHLAECNHAEALRQFELYRRVLRDELGLGPSPAIRGLVAPLLGRPADRSPTPSQRSARGHR